MPTNHVKQIAATFSHAILAAEEYVDECRGLDLTGVIVTFEEDKNRWCVAVLHDDGTGITQDKFYV